MQKPPTSKLQKHAYNSAAARETGGVTSCFETYKRVVLKLLTSKKLTTKGQIKNEQCNRQSKQHTNKKEDDNTMAENNTETKIQMLTIKEAAALVDGLTEFRVRQMCRSGELPCFKAGKKYLINKDILYKTLNGELSVK